MAANDLAGVNEGSNDMPTFHQYVTMNGSFGKPEVPRSPPGSLAAAG